MWINSDVLHLISIDICKNLYFYVIIDIMSELKSYVRYEIENYADGSWGYKIIYQHK